MLENRRQTELVGLRQYLEAAECPSDSPLYGELLLARADELPVSEIPELLGRLIASEQEKTQVLEEQLTQLAEQSSRMEQQLGAAQQRAEARKQLEREQQLLDSAKAEEEFALQAEQQAESTKERQEQLAGWLAVAREKLPQYAELERARLAVRERSGALERAQGQLERIEAAAKALTDRREQLEQERANANRNIENENLDL